MPLVIRLTLHAYACVFKKEKEKKITKIKQNGKKRQNPPPLPKKKNQTNKKNQLNTKNSQEKAKR